jgi:hypothetical protein
MPGIYRTRSKEMAELNLNFQKAANHSPTENEICQIECVAAGIEAIIKLLGAYAADDHDNTVSICSAVCDTLELLIYPVVDYLAEHAGKEAAHD